MLYYITASNKDENCTPIQQTYYSSNFLLSIFFANLRMGYLYIQTVVAIVKARRACSMFIADEIAFSPQHANLVK